MFKDIFPTLGFCPFHAALYIFNAFLTFRFIKFLYILCRSVWGHFIARPLNLEPYRQRWTVFTGCTDGIGRAYLEELVSTRNIKNLYLIGRNKTKLAALAKHFEGEYGCQVRTAVFDFEKDPLEDLPAELKTMNVGILVNSVGIAPEQVDTVVDQPEGLSSKILKVNLLSIVKMIELILPGMVERDCGIIVNISSIMGWRPFPYLSTYPASKAAISFFSDALADEFKHTNIKIQCLIPSLVSTKLASYEPGDTELFVVDTNVFAKQAVNIIGKCRLSTGCFQHDLQIAFGNLLGFWLFKKIYVPFGMLGHHRKRMDAYRKKHENGKTIMKNCEEINGK
uniref:Uncharacterized protein n=1 Tax=Meloidogyne enterolobii TaxID=390850 RepID=A0A6V7UAL1_MELEN|nr:unnamed protein product [Meloidogyne enterolobii]